MSLFTGANSKASSPSYVYPHITDTETELLKGFRKLGVLT